MREEEVCGFEDSRARELENSNFERGKRKEKRNGSLCFFTQYAEVTLLYCKYDVAAVPIVSDTGSCYVRRLAGRYLGKLLF